MTIQEIGCCGAYCRTCKSLASKNCLGCKLGYGEGKRDIKKAKCAVKVCCFIEREQNTCADCDDYKKCTLIGDWFNKKGYKYKKYKESIEFIRSYGYTKFIDFANTWKNQYGRLR